MNVQICMPMMTSMTNKIKKHIVLYKNTTIAVYFSKKSTDKTFEALTKHARISQTAFTNGGDISGQAKSTIFARLNRTKWCITQSSLYLNQEDVIIIHFNLYKHEYNLS